MPSLHEYPAVCLSLLALLTASPLSAGTLAVTAGAAASGAHGLEATIGPPCAGTNERLVDSPATISGTFQACSRLVAKSVQVTGATTFTAGVEIELQNDFSVASGIDFTAVLSPALTPLAFVTDQTPAALIDYFAAYQLRVDSLTLMTGDAPAHLRGRAADGTVLFEVGLKRDVGMGENRLVLSARNDDGSVAETAARFVGDGPLPRGTEVALPAGWSDIGVDWSARDGDGFLAVYVGDTMSASLDNLDNDLARLESVEWGVVGGEFPTASGKVEIDRFDSSRFLQAAGAECSATGGSGGLAPGKHATMIAGHPAEIVVGDGYDPTVPTFLAIRLHGDDGSYQFIGAIEAFINEQDWVYVAPQAAESSPGSHVWSGDFSPAAIAAALDHVSGVLDHMFANYNVCRNILFGGSVSGGSYFYDGHFFPRRGGSYPAFWNLCCGASQLGQPPFFTDEAALVEMLGMNPDIVARSEFKYTIGDQDFLYNQALTSEPVYSGAGFSVIPDHLAGVGHCAFDTNQSIRDYWDSKLLIAIFSDGFESGDVSAWSSATP